MNEQIKKLLDQATVDAIDATKDAVDFLDNPVGRQQRELQLEKFAELIVLECERVSLRSSHRDDDMGAIIARQIKQHFGVEE
jgi:hypothetical protein